MGYKIEGGIRDQDRSAFIDHVVSRYRFRKPGQASYTESRLGMIGMTSMFYGNDVLLLHRIGKPETDRRPARDPYWSVICGYIDRKMSIEAHAVREIGQEAGIMVDQSDVVISNSYLLHNEEDKVHIVWPSKVDLDTSLGRPEVTLNEEHDRYAWVPTESILDGTFAEKFLSDLPFAIQAASRRVDYPGAQPLSAILPLFDQAAA